MTDRQRAAVLARARKNLERTKEGFDAYEESGRGTAWKAALADIDLLLRDLKASQVPALGPVVAGGRSILDQDLTHATSGIPGYPAFDDGWVAGKEVIAPEPLQVTQQSSAQGGDAFYATGASKIRYWFGHVDAAPLTGKRFKKGDVLARISAQHPRPHVHVGINVQSLVGFELLHNLNYTHGKPTVGAQLRKALA